MTTGPASSEPTGESFAPTFDYTMVDRYGQKIVFSAYQIGCLALRQCGVEERHISDGSTVDVTGAWAIDYWPSGLSIFVTQRLRCALIVADELALVAPAPEHGLRWSDAPRWIAPFKRWIDLVDALCVRYGDDEPVPTWLEWRAWVDVAELRAKHGARPPFMRTFILELREAAREGAL